MIENTYLSKRMSMENLTNKYRNMASGLYAIGANEMTVVHLQNFMLYAYNSDSMIKTRENLNSICWHESEDVIAQVLNIYDLFSREYAL